MELDLNRLKELTNKRNTEIEEIVADSDYQPKKVIGVITFLLDNEGNIDLLTAKQQVTFEKFIKPLLNGTA